jgi:type IV secretory pathway VirB10-like protein
MAMALTPPKAVVAVVGLVVFTTLSHGRQGRPQERVIKPVPVAVAATSAPVLMPALATLSPGGGGVMPAAILPTAAPAGPAPDARLHAPAMVVDLGDEAVAAGAGLGAGPAAAPRAAAAEAKAGESDRLDPGISAGGVATATRLRDTALVAPQGTVIPAVMETAVTLDLPGFARAVVSRDVRGFDGSTVLIPRGSHLIGQYRGGVAAGQSRAFIVWSRVLTPDGVSIDIASPGADRLGRSGVEGETNTHFFRRFGNSILLSVLSAGLEAASNNNHGGNTAIVIGSQQQASSVATIALQREINIPDTVTVAQGTPIRVFVARDLDFSSVAGRAR